MNNPAIFSLKVPNPTKNLDDSLVSCTVGLPTISIAWTHSAFIVNNESSIKSTQERAFTKGTLVSPSAVASPKRVCSGLERLYLAGHGNDKLLWKKNRSLPKKFACLQIACVLTFSMWCSSKPALSLQSPPATGGTKTGLMPESRNCLISTGFHPPSGILAPSKFSCTQAPSCLNSLKDSFKALWTVSSDSLVVLVNACNILCHHLVLRDFVQSFSFAVAFKFRSSLDACISFHLYSLTLHFCCDDTRVRAPLSEPTSSATSRDCVTTTTCPCSKAARARLINNFPSSPSRLSKTLSRTNCKRTPLSDKIPKRFAATAGM